MSTVTVNLTQSAWNLRAHSVTTLADSVDIFFLAGHAFSTSHPSDSSAFLRSSSASRSFADGGYEWYSGVVDLKPGAAIGQATATAFEEYAPNAFRLTFRGNLTFDYVSSPNGTSIEGSGGTINSATLQTLLPTNSPAYNSELGNVLVSLFGALGASADGSLNGTVLVSLFGALGASADGSFNGTVNYFLAQALADNPHISEIRGNFNVSGNGTDIGMGLASTKLNGTLTSFTDKYLDGSQVSVSDVSVAVTGTTVIDERMLADASNFSGNDVISITLPASVATPWTIASGSGDDAVTILGGGAALSVNAGSGNDTITLLDNGHAVDGGDGIDTVSLLGGWSDYTFTRNGDAYTLASVGQASNVLRHVETLKFNGNPVSLEYEDVVQALYVAYFGRPADFLGMQNFKQQLKALDAPHDISGVSAAYNTNAGIRALIDSFGSSKESQELYPGDTLVFVTTIYLNVLGRAPDAEGLNFWADAIDHHGLTKASASLSIMAGALTNSSSQGKLDAALVNNRTSIASDFTFLIDTGLELVTYAGNRAAATVRDMLAMVNADTDLVAFQPTVEQTLYRLSFSTNDYLIGSAGHDAPFFV